MKVLSFVKVLVLFGTIHNICFGNSDKKSPHNEVEITIRFAQSIKEVENLLTYIYNEDKNIRWFINELSEGINEDWFTEALNNRCVWLAYCDDKAIGMSVLRVYNPWWDELADGKDRMELQSLLVVSAMCSQGIGHTLYQVVEDTAKAKGATWLTLNAVAEAIPFYLKRGFEDARKTKYGFFMKKSLTGTMHS